MPSKKGPVIRHTKMGAERRKLQGVLTAFKNEMESSLPRLLESALSGLNWRSMEDADLKAQRKKLLETAKSGMLGRKDLEVEIGILAAVVWLNRQERGRRDRILEEWG